MRNSGTKMKHCFFRLIALALVLTISMSMLEVNAANKSVTVSTLKKLKVELKKSKAKTIVFSTKSSKTYTISKIKGSSNKKLVIDAPNATIVNKTDVKSVTVKNCKKYKERRSGNIVSLTGKNAVFVVESGYSVKKLIVSSDKAEVYINKNSKIIELSCNKKSASVLLNVQKCAEVSANIEKKSSLQVSGSTKSYVNINSEAKGSSITTSVPIEITANADMKLELNKGAEGSVVDSAKKASVNIEDLSEGNITVKKEGKIVNNSDPKPTSTPKLTDLVIVTTTPTPEITSTLISEVVPIVTQSVVPTVTQSVVPTVTQSIVPTVTQSVVPTITQSVIPTVTQSVVPTTMPSPLTTATPSLQPTATVSLMPTTTPSSLPTATPSLQPTATPSPQPTATPSPLPTATPSPQPTVTPSLRPTATPNLQPTATPSPLPTATPSPQPTATPSLRPTTMPSPLPTATPSSLPTATPSPLPTATPSPSPTATPIPTAAPNDGKTSVYVKYNQSKARELFDKVNPYRQANGTNAQSSNPLTYDYDLEKVAMQRAAEIAVKYSDNHVRPDGKDYKFTFEENGFNTGRGSMYAENILYGTNDIMTPDAAFSEFCNASNSVNMLGYYTIAAVSNVKVDKTDFWVIVFSNRASNDTYTVPVDDSIYVPLSIPTDIVNNGNIRLEYVSGDKSIAVGSTVPTPICIPYVRFSGSQADEIPISQAVFTSGDGYVSVNNGMMTGLKPGTGTITAQILGQTVSFTITVY